MHRQPNEMREGATRARLLPRRVTFRSTRRRSHHRGLLVYRLLEGALASDPHPYKASPANRPPDQPHSRTGKANRIADRQDWSFHGSSPRGTGAGAGRGAPAPPYFSLSSLLTAFPAF